MGYLFDPDNWEWVTSGNNLRFLLEAFLINLEIAAIAMVLSLIAGLLLALGRLARLRPLSMAAGAWVDVWRNLPLIFIMLYAFLAAPDSWLRAWEDNAPGFLPEALQSGQAFAGILALVLYNSAVIAEIMRAGILSLDRGQGEAAASLGLTYPQQLRYVILPQGLRRMVQAPVLQVFIFIGVLFVVTNFILSRLSRRLEIRERKRTGGTAGPVIGLEDQTALAAEAR